MVKYIIGNWKMHGSSALAAELVHASVQASHAGAKVVLAPPYVYLREVAGLIAGSDVALAGQDCHSEPKGAHTGEVCAAMLKEAGCTYVIVGHSERREAFRETDAQVRAKAEAAISQGLTPVICVGEERGAREAGQAEEIVGAQLKDSLPQSGKFILAYEPIWAIGTGLTATQGDIVAMHAFIAKRAGADVPVLYGGSVKAANAAEILATPGVSGVLVGGASVVADEFMNIIRAAH